MTNLRLVLLATTALTAMQLIAPPSHAQTAPLVMAQAKEEEGKPKQPPKAAPPPGRAAPPAAAPPRPAPPAAAPPPRPAPGLPRLRLRLPIPRRPRRPLRMSRRPRQHQPRRRIPRHRPRQAPRRPCNLSRDWRQLRCRPPGAPNNCLQAQVRRRPPPHRLKLHLRDRPRAVQRRRPRAISDRRRTMRPRMRYRHRRMLRPQAVAGKPRCPREARPWHIARPRRSQRRSRRRLRRP
jgi:hypothetical protein